MPNCTGSESVQASQPKKKISLLEACSVDSNRAAFQVAAYIGFESGVRRGSGPTIFGLAFWHADMARSVSAHEKATNYLMEANGKFDLLRFAPLIGDIQTKSVKRKGVATDNIGLGRKIHIIMTQFFLLHRLGLNLGGGTCIQMILFVKDNNQQQMSQLSKSFL